MRSVSEMVVAGALSIVVGAIYRGFVFPMCGRLLKWLFVTCPKRLFLRLTGRHPAKGSGSLGEEVDGIEVGSGQRLRRLPNETSQ